MKNVISVNEESTLYDFLRNNLNESKNNIKGFLAKKMVSVNGKIVTRFNYELHVGDTIDIGNKIIESYKKEIEIIYEDNQIIVVNKPSGLLTIATEKERNVTLYNMISSYVKKSDKKNKIFIIHRLDKDTSGVIVFAKNEEVKNEMQLNWNNKTLRKYVAIVHGRPKDVDTLELHLRDAKKGGYTYVVKNGDIALTKYKRIASDDKYSYLDLDLLTGRKNQIRVSLAYIGCPIYGDKKYGVEDSGKRLMLHAYKLELINPITKQRMIFTADIPKEFYNMKKNMVNRSKNYE